MRGVLDVHYELPDKYEGGDGTLDPTDKENVEFNVEVLQKRNGQSWTTVEGKMSKNSPTTTSFTDKNLDKDQRFRVWVDDLHEGALLKTQVSAKAVNDSIMKNEYFDEPCDVSNDPNCPSTGVKSKNQDFTVKKSIWHIVGDKPSDFMAYGDADFPNHEKIPAGLRLSDTVSWTKASTIDQCKKDCMDRTTTPTSGGTTIPCNAFTFFADDGMSSDPSMKCKLMTVPGFVDVNEQTWKNEKTDLKCSIDDCNKVKSEIRKECIDECICDPTKPDEPCAQINELRRNPKRIPWRAHGFLLHPDTHNMTCTMDNNDCTTKGFTFGPQVWQGIQGDKLDEYKTKYIDEDAANWHQVKDLKECAETCKNDYECRLFTYFTNGGRSSNPTENCKTFKPVKFKTDFTKYKWVQAESDDRERIHGAFLPKMKNTCVIGGSDPTTKCKGGEYDQFLQGIGEDWNVPVEWSLVSDKKDKQINDKLKLDTVGALSVLDCQTICAKTDGCTSYSYNDDISPQPTTNCVLSKVPMTNDVNKVDFVDRGDTIDRFHGFSLPVNVANNTGCKIPNTNYKTSTYKRIDDKQQHYFVNKVHQGTKKGTGKTHFDLGRYTTQPNRKHCEDLCTNMGPACSVYTYWDRGGWHSDPSKNCKTARVHPQTTSNPESRIKWLQSKTPTSQESRLHGVKVYDTSGGDSSKNCQTSDCYLTDWEIDGECNATQCLQTGKQKYKRERVGAKDGGNCAVTKKLPLTKLVDCKKKDGCEEDFRFVIDKPTQHVSGSVVDWTTQPNYIACSTYCDSLNECNAFSYITKGVYSGDPSKNCKTMNIPSQQLDANSFKWVNNKTNKTFVHGFKGPPMANTCDLRTCSPPEDCVTSNWSAWDPTDASLDTSQACGIDRVQTARRTHTASKHGGNNNCETDETKTQTYNRACKSESQSCTNHHDCGFGLKCSEGKCQASKYRMVLDKPTQYVALEDKGWHHNIPNYTECSRKCDATDGCNAFTYFNRNGAFGVPDKNCKLMNYNLDYPTDANNLEWASSNRDAQRVHGFHAPPMKNISCILGEDCATPIDCTHDEWSDWHPTSKYLNVHQACGHDITQTATQQVKQQGEKGGDNNCETKTKTQNYNRACLAKNNKGCVHNYDCASGLKCFKGYCREKKDCTYNKWKAWSPTDASIDARNHGCGQNVTQTATRTYNAGAYGGDNTCSNKSNLRKTQTRTAPACPVDCTYNAYSAWSPTDASIDARNHGCGQNVTQTATRTYNAGAHGGDNTCSDAANLTKTQTRTAPACPVNCTYNAYSAWSPTDASIDAGDHGCGQNVTQTATRTYNAGAHGGDTTCSDAANLTKTQTRTAPACKTYHTHFTNKLQEYVHDPSSIGTWSAQNTEDKCKRRCDSEATCKAYTYFIRGGQGSDPSKNCKTMSTDLKNSKWLTSGSSTASRARHHGFTTKGHQAWGECTNAANCATVRTDGKTDPLKCRWNGFVDKRCLDLPGAEWACWNHGDKTGVPHKYNAGTDTCEPQPQCNVGACNEWIRDMVVNKKWAFGNLHATKCAHCPHREYRGGSYKTVKGGSWIGLNKPMSDTTGRYNLIKLPE